MRDSYREERERESAKMRRNIKWGFYGVGGFIGFLFAGWVFGNALTWVDAGEIVVIQSPITGDLAVVTTPGPAWQGWGTITPYPRRRQAIFHAPLTRVCHPAFAAQAAQAKQIPDCSNDPDTSIQVRYNDGGHAWVSGQISWEMPLAAEAVIKLHQEFRSTEAIERQLVQPSVIKAFYQTGPLMSSTESYASRRTEFLELFQDQLRFGLYRTRAVTVQEPDPITGEIKTIAKTDIVMGADGMPQRSEASAFALYQVSLPLATITAIDYDPSVEAQIASQRDATLNVQTAQAASRRAEQDALTALKEGEAASAKARAAQEAIKATEVTQAEKTRDVALITAQQQRDVAKLDQEAAEFTKRRDILLGEGEAARKRLVMEADGALAAKLDAYIKVNDMYAKAIGSHQGSWVPSVVMGNSGTGAANGGAQQLMEMFSVKTARDLALEMNISGKQK